MCGKFIKMDRVHIHDHNNDITFMN
jgi:hypothetical protein